jgi:hypothetical protein
MAIETSLQSRTLLVFHVLQVSDAAKKKKLAKNASKTKKLGTAGTAADKSSEQNTPAMSRDQVLQRHRVFAQQWNSPALPSLFMHKLR